MFLQHHTNLYITTSSECSHTHNTQADRQTDRQTHKLDRRKRLLHFWYYDAVDASQFDIDLQAQVRNGLDRDLVNILGLHTLGGHP